MGAPKKELADSRLGVQISGRTFGKAVEPISCGKEVVILLSCGCGVGPEKKESMEEADSRLGCRSEKGKKERPGTSDEAFGESFSCGEVFKGAVLLGLRECVSTSLKVS